MVAKGRRPKIGVTIEAGMTVYLTSIVRIKFVQAKHSFSFQMCKRYYTVELQWLEH